MNVLLIGAGGREHALAWALSASPLLTKLFCAPGNPGIAEVAQCIPIDPADHDVIITFCRDERIELVVIGPEAPLVAGLGDALGEAGIKYFGPTRAAAQLEGSKGFTKDLCRTANIPTAAYGRFMDPEAAKTYLGVARPADRRQGRRTRRPARASSSRRRGKKPRPPSMPVFRRLRHGWQRDRHRRISRGRGSELLRALRRRDGAAARLGARSQARRRRRHRPEYRRHGRLFTGADHHARNGRPRHARDHHTDGEGDGRARHAIQRRAVRGLDDFGDRGRSSSNSTSASAIPKRRC